MDNGLLQERVRSVLKELELMIGKTEGAANRGADHRTLAAIADYLSLIRVELGELAKAGALRPDGQSQAAADLTARYSRLEGWIKELRNDAEPADARGGSGVRAGNSDNWRRAE